MKAITFPIYQSIFPNEEIPSIDQLLNACSSSRLLRSIAYLNSKIHKRQDDLDSQEKIFNDWISCFNVENRKAISKNYAQFKLEIYREGGAVVLFNSMPLLKLMDSIIGHYNNISETELNNEFAEMCLFKAWLLSNEYFRFEVPENAEPNLENLFKAILVNKSIQYEFMRPKLFHYQILLGSAFFKYFADDLTLKIYLENFLNGKKIYAYPEYLRRLMDVYMDEFSGQNFGFGLTGGTSSFADFYNSLALAYHDATDLESARLLGGHPDFRLFREKPLVRREDGTYYLVHYNFFVDKLYQGLVFDFYHQSGISKKHKSIPSFLQFLGQDFAERHLFYKFLPQCFTGKYVVKIPGEMYTEIEYSDFYVRDGQSLFLFEFKNVIMGVAAKHSKNFSKIRDGIVEKLVLTTDGQSKGVTQLAKTIERLLVTPFHFDDYKLKRIGKLQIFPVIVYTDDFFEVDGVQTIISEEFSSLKLNSSLLSASRHSIHDVTLVHLHDIIDISCEATATGHFFKDRLVNNLKKRKQKLRKKDTSAWEFLSKHSSERLSINGRSHDGVECLRNLLKDALGYQFDEENQPIQISS